jgi:hypothetical protein
MILIGRSLENFSRRPGKYLTDRDFLGAAHKVWPAIADIC